MALTKISGSILKDPLNLGEVSIGGTLTYEDVTNVDSVGIVTARSGIHIDDSITHIGDTNTKIRFPAADTITAETGGSERLRIDSSGNIKLTPSAYQTLAIKQFGYGSSYQSIMVGNPNSNVGVVALNVDVSGISGSNFHAKDQVVTGYRGFITPNAAGNNFIGVFTRDASADKIYFGPSISSGLTNGPITATTSKVGINEDVPQSTLHVASTSNYVDIGLSNSTSGHTGSDGANIFLNNNLELALWNRESTGVIRFATAGTERLRIDSSGRLMIGTTDASQFNSSADDFVISRAGHAGITIDSTSSHNSSIFFADGPTGTEAYRGYVQYSHNLDQLRLGAAAADQVQISSGNVEIVDGNLVIGTSGHGIDFSATSDAGGSTSELLDDYEEGSWTPTAHGYTGSNTINNCYYTKIGRLVTASFRITWPSLTSNSAAEIRGLPFTAISTAQYIFGGAFSETNDNDNLSFIVVGNSNNMLILRCTSSGVSAQTISEVSGKDFRGIVSYFTNS